MRKKKPSAEETKAAVIALMRSAMSARVPLNQIHEWNLTTFNNYVESYFKENPESYGYAVASAESSAAIHIYKALKPALLDWMKGKAELLENPSSPY